ncbi:MULTISPECIES: hypothetical protein [Rhodococcus]|nr:MULTISPECIES: hypothetical protein [Rhodococcus]MCE4267731.1 hypothetical protein [Rhodococcus globerulus]QXW03624.1 hypothetical protein KYT97_06105 [Rhodococcus globerulus]
MVASRGAWKVIAERANHARIVDAFADVGNAVTASRDAEAGPKVVAR